MEPTSGEHYTAAQFNDGLLVKKSKSPVWKPNISWRNFSEVCCMLII